LKIKAYILAADPAWIEASVCSYYHLIDELVVSYDENGIGYTGVAVAVEECLRRLKAIDREGKFRYAPGHYARLDHKPMENETYQRQQALDEASQGADWVLQLDSDEVMGDSDVFASCLNQADVGNFAAMDYPSRWIYRQLGDGRYLEACRPQWRIMGGYPGAMAVRAGTKLSHARQCEGALFRVDFRARNTDPWRGRDATVHRVVGDEQGIYHFSMVRSEAALRRKTETFSHALDANWTAILDHWLWCGRHPYRAAMRALFLLRGNKQFYKRPLRISTVRLPRDLAGLNDQDGGVLNGAVPGRSAVGV